MTRLPHQVLVYIRRRPTLTSSEYVLLRRTSARGGFWQGVSGGEEAGESPAEAARREDREEAGYQQLSQFMPLGLPPQLSPGSGRLGPSLCPRGRRDSRRALWS
jgi:8-oxo-dGTP pyrophosphatase MutT (NUDIX family)